MDSHAIINLALFSGIFLAITAGLHSLSKKYALPYTVILFLIGFAVSAFHLGGIIGLHGYLPTEFIFYFLLPLLLFESALHINFHQFKLQFKTITFISTFGLLVSIFVIGAGLPLLIGLPIEVALLFGAVISATDPVAVLALFKTLPVPHRLSLLVDGESMFNDGTGVIAFKLVSSLVIGGIAFNANNMFSSLAQFSYVFLGAILFGLGVGYGVTMVLAQARQDRIVATTLTVATALGTFILAEHYLHVSGVISTVMVGTVIGNLGMTKFSAEISDFIEDFWDYVAFVTNSIVFFFIGAIYNPYLLIAKPLTIIATIAMVLVARSLSVYITFAISNQLPLFKNEPNVPLRWQHLINWGGLRGTIPIVLVFTIPDSYQFKDLIVTLTLSSVMFTLVVNGATTAWLLKKLGLHLPKREEEIIANEKKIFSIHQALTALEELARTEVDPSILKQIAAELRQEEDKLRKHVLNRSNAPEFLRSLKIQGLEIERASLTQMLRQGLINEDSFYDFSSELDLQQDFVEYNTFTDDTGTYGFGQMNTKSSFRRRLTQLRRWRHHIPVLGKLFRSTEDSTILDRYILLKARIQSSREVLAYLDHIVKIIDKPELIAMTEKVRQEHQYFIQKNTAESEKIYRQHRKLLQYYQEEIARNYISRQSAGQLLSLT